ncbi:aldo/keto reductase [bacterium]|nr:aldo/keto reductase [bacterium]
MKKRKIGTSDMTVTEISLGTNAVGGHNLYENIKDEDGINLVNKAFDLGINFFDTADVYGLGRSEELISEALGTKINKVYVATKGSIRWDDQLNFSIDNSPEYLRSALEKSLKRLNRDYVDLYYIHKPDGKTPIEESVGALMKFKEEGKIRYGGVSNFSLNQLKEATNAGEIIALQSEYHILNRQVEQEGILDFCKSSKIAFIPYGTLGFGILTGKYKIDFKLNEGDWRKSVPLFNAENFAKNLAVVKKLELIAKKYDASIAHLAQRWVLRHDFVPTSITGAKKPEQVEDNFKAAAWELAEDDIDAIDKILFT